MGAEFPAAANRRKTFRDRVQRGDRIRRRRAGFIRRPTERNFLARAPRDVQLANRDGAGRHVEREMLVLQAGCGHGNRVRAEARLLRKGRQDRRLARPCHAHTDHAAIRRHRGVDAGRPEVVGPPYQVTTPTPNSFARPQAISIAFVVA